MPPEELSHPVSRWLYLGAAIVLGVAWLLYITGPGGDHDRRLRTRLGRAWRRIIFALRGVRRVRRFPWLTWAVSQHRVDYEEALAALPLIRPGDVGLHREEGYLGNFAVPGFMKHAWIHVSGPLLFAAPDGRELADVSGLEVVEAAREGVLRRSALHPLRSDYVVILRPREVTAEETARAVGKAAALVGCRYDVDCRLDLEAELRYFGQSGRPEELAADYRRELEMLATNLQAEWDGGFSSSEAVSFAWWHVRRRLRLFRRKVRGKQVILPDDMINNGFEIVWLSDSVTPEAAVRLGLGEEGADMIRRWREAHPARLFAPERRGGRFWRRVLRRFGARVRAEPTDPAPPAGG